MQAGLALVSLAELVLLAVVWRWADTYRQDHGEGNGFVLVLAGGAFWLAGALALLRSLSPSELDPGLSRRLSLAVATCGVAVVLVVLLLAQDAAS